VVSVVIGVSEKTPPSVQKGKIDTPRVDPHTGRRTIELGGIRGETSLDFGPESERIPVMVAQDFYGAVRESVELLEIKKRPVPAAHKNPSAGSAEIDGEEVGRFLHGNGSLSRGYWRTGMVESWVQKTTRPNSVFYIRHSITPILHLTL
jgi:hypothetical protein